MKPLSLDLRQRIVAAYENGEGSHQELAERFAVSKAFILISRAERSSARESRIVGGSPWHDGLTTATAMAFTRPDGAGRCLLYVLRPGNGA